MQKQKIASFCTLKKLGAFRVVIDHWSVHKILELDFCFSPLFPQKFVPKYGGTMERPAQHNMTDRGGDPYRLPACMISYLSRQTHT